MSKILKLTASNRTILAESSDLSETGGTIVQAGGGIEFVKKNLDKILEAIHPISNSIIKTFEDLSKKPDSATAEFGFKFSAEGNLILAKASGEASLTISLTWNQPTTN